MLAKQVLLIILCKIVVKIIAINLFNNPNRVDIHNISKPLIEILQGCFQNNLNPLIITEQSSKYVFYNPNQALLSSSSIILMNNDFKIQHHARNYNPHIGTFLLTASTEDQLNKTISQLQSTPWWNTESYFLLIGSSTHSSADASKMLAMMWKRKILSVVYLSYDIDKEAVMLYTFNPFNNYAPSPWKWVDEIKEKPDPRWNLYEHQYQKGFVTICPIIMFDKTLKLDDYVISALIERNLHPKEVPTAVPIRLNDYKKYAPLMGIPVMTEVFIQMKVRVNITDIKSIPMRRNGTLYGSPQELLDHDIYLKTVPMYLNYNSTTYPDIMLSLVLLSQKRPFLNTESKIFSFFHSNILIPIILVFLTSVIILKINRQQNFTSVLLKVWQLFLGKNIPQVLNNTPTRIFFFGVFWLVIILNGAFQSKLSSFLTKPERIYVNSIEDAFQLQYHIYGLHDFMIDEPVYTNLSPSQRKYIHFMDTHQCVAPVLNNSQALCLTSPNYSTRNAIQYGLHISPPIHVYYSVHWVSSEFPLRGRINRVLLHLQASGIIVQLYKKIFYDRLDYIHAHENDETKFQSRPIELHDLRFIFKLLILGHICSLIIFLVELRHR